MAAVMETLEGEIILITGTEANDGSLGVAVDSGYRDSGSGGGDEAGAPAPGSETEIERSDTHALIYSASRWASLDTYEPAPLWMLQYIGGLVAIMQHKRPLRVVVAPQTFFDNIAPGRAAGACMMRPDGEDVIVMPEHAVDSEEWRDVLAHEFAHSMHTPLDRIAIETMDTETAATYERELEAHVRAVGGLVAFAADYVQVRATDK